jgi:two-component system sensor histidine kinase KdpD
MKKKRLNPEQILQETAAEERAKNQGKLKVYLGAAPGVGKTYAMLHDALEERKKGLDVVIGVVESHGRQEIEDMLQQFEALPEQAVEYHGKTLWEFNLKASLKRNPGLILMDEMAHSNAPDLQHPKRWQDIKELLDRGINVYTTLNIQHIESIKEDVFQIIQAPIHEIVPDSMLDIADTIELVDIPVEELLQRLDEGKVYIPEQAEIAKEHFFKKEKLVALRELALRTTAKFVGTQVLLYRRGKKTSSNRLPNEKILVCVESKPETLKLIHAAHRLADNLMTEWVAVYVESPATISLVEKRKNAIENLSSAERLGAKTHILTGLNIAATILEFAKEQNVTLIMIWKYIGFRFKDLFFKSLADKLLQAGELDVYIMTGTLKKTNPSTTPSPLIKKTISWKYYGISIAIVAAATALNFALLPIFGGNNLIAVYLLGVTLIAVLGQTGPSILGSVLSVLAYDFFFISPVHTFSLSNIQSLPTLIIMLIIAEVISHLTILTRRQAGMAKQAERQTSALYSLSQQLASARGVNKLLDIGTSYMSELLNSDIQALMPKNNHLTLIGKQKPKKKLTDKELSVAQWVYELGQMAGLGTNTLSLSEALYVPLQGSQQVLGVLRIHPRNQEQLQDPQNMRLIEASSHQLALALEVDQLQEKHKVSELQDEIDRIRNTLLQAVAHNLRTPLISIMTTSKALIDMDEFISKDKIKALCKSLYVEVEQLNRLISNLLQIAYLEKGAVKLDKQLSSLKELIIKVIKNSETKLKDRVIHTSIPDTIPEVPIDKVLIEEVFMNLLDNAIKFTPSNTDIDIYVIEQETRFIQISVEDRGPGIVDDEVDKLFEKFYRGRKLTTERGLGLGLAICQKIIHVHGGRIWANNRDQGGAAFHFTLPL